MFSWARDWLRAVYCRSPVSKGKVSLSVSLSMGSVCRAEPVGSARRGNEAVEQSVNRRVERRGQREAQLRVERHRVFGALLCDLTPGEGAARQLLTKQYT